MQQCVFISFMGVCVLLSEMFNVTLTVLWKDQVLITFCLSARLAIFTSAVWEVSAHIWISLEIYVTTSFWNSPCFSGEWWMKAPLRHLRKSLANHCKKLLLRNLSDKCEQEAEQVQMSSNNLTEQMQTSRAVICGFVSMFPPCTSVSNMNIKASGVKMSWKQSALSKLRPRLKASTLFVVLKWTVSLIIHHNNLDRHEQHDTEHSTNAQQLSLKQWTIMWLAVQTQFL